jgi:hypothetical protein
MTVPLFDVGASRSRVASCKRTTTTFELDADDTGLLL